jgi:hypothetical protein
MYSSIDYIGGVIGGDAVVELKLNLHEALS